MLSSFLSKIASAQSLKELELVRYGLDGFETLYFKGQFSYTDYLTIYGVYAQKYSVLAMLPTTPILPIASTKSNLFWWIAGGVAVLALITKKVARR